jgi:hypothetical protein
MKKCKTCSKDAGVYGIDDIPYTEIVSAVVSAIATAQIDKAVTTNADGTAKENFLATNPMMKNALYLVGGGLLTSMDGEMYKGAGIGMATYGGFNLVQGLMEQYMPTTNGVTGLKFVPPQSMVGNVPAKQLGLYHIPGNSGVAPSVLGHPQKGMKIPFEKATQSMKEPVAVFSR